MLSQLFERAWKANSEAELRAIYAELLNISESGELLTKLTVMNVIIINPYITSDFLVELIKLHTENFVILSMVMNSPSVTVEVISQMYAVLYNHYETSKRLQLPRMDGYLLLSNLVICSKYLDTAMKIAIVTGSLGEQAAQVMRLEMRSMR